MSLTHEKFVADVAAVYAGDSEDGAFGSGRLIAPGLVLTAGHVVDYPTREAPMRTGWKVLLLREQGQDGAWGKPHDAELVWRGLSDLDLALLQVIGDTKLLPEVAPVFVSIKWIDTIAAYTTGFPKAWRTVERTRDYNVSGTLWIATRHGAIRMDRATGCQPRQTARLGGHIWRGCMSYWRGR